MTKTFKTVRSIVSLALATCVVSAAAQTPTQQVLGTADEVVQTINTATDEILVVTNVLHTAEIAEALREALAVRGVPVFILTSPSTVEENASYVASLAHAGASVRLSEVGGSFLVIDRQLTIAGPLIGSLGRGDENTPTILIDEPSYAAQFIEGFVQSFEAARVYTPVGQQ